MRTEIPPKLAAVPCLERCPDARFSLQGWIGERLEGVTRQWLRVAPLANPAMLEMFRDRDRTPRRDLVPWAGEFAGKYLIGAVEVLRLTGDSGLRSVLEQFVRELLSLQDDDGYLGPWPRAHRLTGWAPNAGRNGGATWDAWGHYHESDEVPAPVEVAGAARPARFPRRHEAAHHPLLRRARRGGLPGGCVERNGVRRRDPGGGGRRGRGTVTWCE